MPEKASVMKVHQILTEILQKITPTEKEQDETKLFLEKVMKSASQILKQYKLSYTLAGSYMRNTWLTSKKEFDIFIMFPESCPREKLEKTGLEIGKKITKKLNGEHVIAYAEHPYVRAKVYTKSVLEKSGLLGKSIPKSASYDIDIVPCYSVKSAQKIKSAVDRTPFHNRWLSENMSPALAPEVRLLKQFAKGIQIYGSDTRVLGVSGYLCELLIVNYKSFKNFLDHTSKWEAGQVFIDLEEHHKEDREPIMKEFRNQPLIVIDPVDPRRNVASSLSPENFAKLVKSSRDFLEKPDEGFFFPRKEKVSPGELKKLADRRGTRFLAVKFRRPGTIDDILWPQLRRTARRLSDILKENEFITYGTYSWADSKDCLLVFEMEVWSLPKVRKLVGPFVFSKKHSEEFITKYSSQRIWVDGIYWVAEVPRKFSQAEDKLKDSLKDSESNLKSKGIASTPAKTIAQKFEILKAHEILEFAKKNQDFAEFLKSSITKRVV
jgi:tRNA nucleotidyltransferase (CCA-adding enzyme)